MTSAYTSKAVKAAGWRAMGVWVPGNAGKDELTMLQSAGVRLLKVDGGDAHCEVTNLAREVAPDLYIEHGLCDDAHCTAQTHT